MRSGSPYGLLASVPNSPFFSSFANFHFAKREKVQHGSNRGPHECRADEKTTGPRRSPKLNSLNIFGIDAVV